MTELFAVTPAIRYVAVRDGSSVELRQRPDLTAASSADSDWYEEVLVNPALVLLATQRGNIDCGGLRYLTVGYGNFTQLVVPSGARGHVSLAFELGANPVEFLERIVEIVGAEQTAG
jgi:hypothetical protein